jgi:hypothetical protein
MPDSTVFSGCGKTKAIGTLFGIVQAHKNNFKFHDVKFYIVKESLPPILGKSFILEHGSVKSGNFRIHGSGMELFLQTGKMVFFPWTTENSILVTNSTPKMVENTKLSSQPISSSDSASKPISNPDSLDMDKKSLKPLEMDKILSTKEKMDFLKKEKQITLKTDIFKGKYLDKLVDLLYSKKNVFKGTNDEIGLFKEQVRIPTIPGLTKAARARPIPKNVQPQVEEEIKKMLDSGIIENCPDGKGFHSPLHIVPKKGNKIRICSDFKSTLNQCLQESTEIWSLPNIDCLFADVEDGNTIFSSLDINSAYWNLEIHPDDRYKTNFLYKDSLYQYKRLPFGMRFSGDAFCKSISKLLATVKHQQNLKSYVDDILLHSKDMETHLTVIEEVLEACANFNAKLGGAKCHFGTKSTKFMGRLISSEGISIPEENMEALQKLPSPTNRKELLSVLGSFVWWKNWISCNIGDQIAVNSFSAVIKEMSLLNKSKKPFLWNDDAEAAFRNAKRILASNKVFSLPNFDYPFVVVTDASLVAIGGAILQKIGNKQKLISVYSKTLSPCESRWSASEREAFGLMMSIEKFSYYLMGSSFLVLTDHKALECIDRKIIANDKIARWQERLSKFTFTCQYLKGTDNTLADMLSRPWHKIRKKPDEKPTEELAGQFYNPVGEKDLLIYLPSWVTDKKLDDKMLIESVDAAATLFTLKSVATGVWCPSVPILELRVIEEAQCQDKMISTVKKFVSNKVEKSKWKAPDDVYGIKRYIC